jgi:Helix-turn-helix domain
MSQEELRRVEVLARVRSGQLRVIDASALLRVSYRQTKRLWKRYREEGAAGLKHRSAGRVSNRGYAREFRCRVLKLVRKKYGGAVGERFGPTLAAEHLASEDRVQMDAETLRRWMLSEGLWSRERKRGKHRERRERKEHFGELVQMDGSFHRWLEERGPQGCLMDMADDASNETLARMDEQETIWAVSDTLLRWIEKHGVPMALYVDWKNLYKRRATTKEQLRGEEPITQFGRMCRKLGIELIAASSPQAKGRIERMHGTHQDRLVKKLRRRGIATYEAANVYLEQEYLPEHNRRFRREAARKEDYHRPAPRAWELDRIFRLESERVVGEDRVVRYANRYFQLEGSNRKDAPARSKVLVCERRHGEITIEYRGREMPYREIAAPAKPSPEVRRSEWQRRAAAVNRRHKPAENHPWKQAARQEAERKAMRLSKARPSLGWPSASP